MQVLSEPGPRSGQAEAGKVVIDAGPDNTGVDMWASREAGSTQASALVALHIRVPVAI